VLPEGAYDLVAPEGAPLAVAVLHPHPDYGGDRRNPVVGACFDAAVDAGWAAIRFDFSSSDTAVARAEAAAALDLLPADAPLAVIGYSFGAAVAGMLTDPRITGWVLVAAPIAAASSLPIGSDPRPKLLLVPEHDQYCPPVVAGEATAAWDLTYLETIRSADHFLAGATGTVAAQAITFLAP
jgi:alpha/beta superfamily hydrolase